MLRLLWALGIADDCPNRLVEAEHFQLYKRAKHVFSEALRVLQFRTLCLNSAESSSDVDFEKLGKLMNESQRSCKELFECSCPELDLLTALCRDAGAFGSRLTGVSVVYFPLPKSDMF